MSSSRSDVPAVVRWLKFNLVGCVGVLVQLGMLQFLSSSLRLGYLVSTFLAVETTLLHNFAWHWVYTWRDRPADGWRPTLSRLARFHLSNGMVSLAGNILLMRLLVGEAGLPPILANVIAILVCSLVNYLAGDRFVFRAQQQSL